MSLFEVTKVGDQWAVYAINPNNPNDRILTNVSETEAYALNLAADLNRLAEIEPMTSIKLAAPVSERPKRKFRFSFGVDETGRKFR